MRLAWLVAVAVLCAGGVQAAQLTGNISTTSVTPGEVFTLTITGEGSKISEPVLPDAPDFVFMNAKNPRVSTGSTVSITNGQVRQSQSRSWTYQLRADKEGSFTLPSIHVTIDGKDYHTEPLKITVSKNAVPQRTQRRRTPFDDFFDPFGSRPAAPPVDETISFEDTALFELTVDKTEVYQGAPLSVTLTYGKLAVDGVQIRADPPQLVHPPNFFLGADEPANNVLQTRNGHQYATAPRKQVWFPTQAGTFTIPPVEWVVGIRRNTVGGVDNSTIVKKTEPVTITVKPLPPAPPEFSGAVGNIQLSSTLSSTDLLQGTPVELVVRVTGQGNPSAVSAPELPQLDWAHVSQPTVDQDPAVTGGALKVFTFTLTPLKEGPQQIPELSLTYFTPETAKYQATIAPALAVNVRKAVETPMVVVGGSQPQNTTTGRTLTEIFPIVRSSGPLEHHDSGWPINVAVLVVPPTIYTGLFLFMRRRRRLSEDTEFARDYFARSKSQKRLAGVRRAKDPSAELFRAMSGFVADKLHIEEGGLTSADARKAIAQRGLGAELAENVEKILRACERARYAGAALSPAELKALLDAARQAMDQLEVALKNGGRA
nr:BatD [uncultured bacterium]